jgi:transposase-like protein
MKYCPKCGSSRIRRGYAHDSVFTRMLGIRELLCDACNLRFRRFVFPGTLPHSSRHKRHSANQQSQDGKRPGQRNSTKRWRHHAKRCPVCASERTHRSHRTGILERLASVANFYPYRCDDCNSRFMAQRQKSPVAGNHTTGGDDHS